MSERPMPKANAANTVPTKKVEKVVKGTVKKKKKSKRERVMVYRKITKRPLWHACQASIERSLSGEAGPSSSRKRQTG